MIATEVRQCILCDATLPDDMDEGDDECAACTEFEENGYPYAKLSDKAKEKARDWWTMTEAHDWEPAWDCHLGPLEHLGIEVDTTCRGSSSVPRHDVDYAVGHSNIWALSDSFCSIEATWRAAKCDMSKLVEDCPQDFALHRICAQLSVLAMRYPDARVYIERATRRGGSNGATARLAAGLPDDVDADIEGEVTGEFEDVFETVNDWLQSALESDYEDSYDIGHIEESIEANEYKFDRDGAVI